MTVPTMTLAIAGGTGSGKTTLADRLFKELGGDENVTVLNHDYYYKDMSHKSPEERAETNFDHPESLETDLLLEHIKTLKQGLPANVPTYDFATHSRRSEETATQPRKIILVEGILIFCHPELVQEMDIKVFVDADSDIRLERRMARDCKERGRTPEQVLAQYHKTVRPMHEEWVEPSKKVADLIVHSTGHSMDVAVQILANHMRFTAGIDTPSATAATTEEEEEE